MLGFGIFVCAEINSKEKYRGIIFDFDQQIEFYCLCKCLVGITKMPKPLNKETNKQGHNFSLSKYFSLNQNMEKLILK